jgi:hypothetical protein
MLLNIVISFSSNTESQVLNEINLYEKNEI